MRGLTAALGHGVKYKDPQTVVDTLIIGGGVVGLAIGQRLTKKYPTKATFVVERHQRVGEETSSRNSEVIHAGIYYPPHSLKTRLCLRGRHLLYEHCDKHNIPYKKLGKLVVALPGQESYIGELHRHAQCLTWPKIPALDSWSSAEWDQTLTPVAPTKLITGAEARSMEPDISQDVTLALYSPETGIVDSHALMAQFEQDIENSEGGEVVLNTKVVRVDPSPQHQGWVVQTLTGGANGEPETDSILAKTLINASGLSSTQVLNHLLTSRDGLRREGLEEKIPMFYARGSYAAYRGPGVNSVKRLIYPVPDHGKKAAGKKVGGHQGLGTHLTLDMDGNVRFGPNVEWIEPPLPSNGEGNGHISDPGAIDFWNRHLTAAESQLPQMYESIRSYLPNISLSGLTPDYVGVRPKLAGPGGGFEDFVVRVDKGGAFTLGGIGKRGGGTMVTLMGIESPGLTSSMALAEMVVDEVLKDELENS